MDTVCGWDFETVLPAHFDSPIKTSGPKLREAFAFLDTGRNDVRYCSDDAAFLNEAGIPAVCYGPGSIEQAHTDDEWVDIRQVHTCADVLEHFTRGLVR